LKLQTTKNTDEREVHEKLVELQ